MHGFRHGLVIAAILGLASCASVGSQPAGSGRERAGPPWLEAMAQRVASENGDATPQTMRWGLVSVAEADPFVGLSPHGNDASVREFIVVMTGRFVCHSCSRPPGAAAPRGRAIVFTGTRKTHSVQDFSVVPSVPNIERLHLHSLGSAA